MRSISKWLISIAILLYSCTTLAVVINDKVSANANINSRNCAGDPCKLLATIAYGTTGTVIDGPRSDTISYWYKVAWDNSSTGWSKESELSILQDNPPDLSSITLPSTASSGKIYFSGYATDDFNIKEVGMIVRGSKAFSRIVSGKTIDFSSYYFDPKDPNYGTGDGSYSIVIYAEDINTTVTKRFQVDVGSNSLDNLPTITSDPTYSVQQGKKIYFSGVMKDDIALSSLSMSVTTPNGKLIDVFTQKISGTSYNLSSFYFDSTLYYAGVAGRYAINFTVVDSKNQQGYYTSYVDVIPTVDNSAQKKELRDQINALKQQKEDALKNQQPYITQTQEKLIAKGLAETAYKDALTEKDKVFQQKNINVDVIPFDKRLDSTVCAYQAEVDKHICNVFNIDSRVKKQEIVVEYTSIDETTYPAIVYGVTDVEDRLLTSGGGLSDGSSSVRKHLVTPAYIVNNNAQLKLVIDAFNKNSSQWTMEATQGFNDELAKIAAAQQVTDFTLFNIDAYKEQMLDVMDMTNDELNLSDETIEKIELIVIDTITSSVPYVGNGKSLIETLNGKNLITHEQLTTTDRSLNVVFIVVPQLKLARLPAKLTVVGVDGKKYAKALLVGSNRTRGLAAAKYLSDHPSLIGLGISRCSDKNITNYSVTMTRRFPDALCNLGKVLIESKVGYMKNTKRLREQLEQDIAIATNDPSKTIYWVSSISSETSAIKKSGFSPKYQEIIDKAVADGKIKKGQIELKTLQIAIDK